jgi:hypothetical protein
MEVGCHAGGLITSPDDGKATNSVHPEPEIDFLRLDIPG